MLSIGEFSNICKVSAKTLRYYAEIGLLEPSEVNPENGYRYYAIEQLETMLLISRLKAYSFSLEEIKALLPAEIRQDDTVYLALLQKKSPGRANPALQPAAVAVNGRHRGPGAGPVPPVLSTRNRSSAGRRPGDVPSVDA